MSLRRHHEPLAGAQCEVEVIQVHTTLMHIMRNVLIYKKATMLAWGS